MSMKTADPSVLLQVCGSSVPLVSHRFYYSAVDCLRSVLCPPNSRTSRVRQSLGAVSDSWSQATDLLDRGYNAAEGLEGSERRKA